MDKAAGRKTRLGKQTCGSTLSSQFSKALQSIHQQGSTKLPSTQKHAYKRSILHHSVQSSPTLLFDYTYADRVKLLKKAKQTRCKHNVNFSDAAPDAKTKQLHRKNSLRNEASFKCKAEQHLALSENLPLKHHLLHAKKWTENLRMYGTDAGKSGVKQNDQFISTVTMSDLLTKLQIVSRSRVFCSAQQFETTLIKLGLDFDDTLVAAVTQACPIADDGIINFTPLYPICHELEKLEQNGLAIDDLKSDSMATKISDHSLKAIDQDESENVKTVSPIETPSRSADLFPVHHFDTSPIATAGSQIIRKSSKSHASKISILVEL